MGQRPPHVKPPAHLSPNPPLPKPGGDKDDARTSIENDLLGRDPTRYGDWELKGIAVDF